MSDSEPVENSSTKDGSARSGQLTDHSKKALTMSSRDPSITAPGESSLVSITTTLKTEARTSPSGRMMMVVRNHENKAVGVITYDKHPEVASADGWPENYELRNKVAIFGNITTFLEEERREGDDLWWRLGREKDSPAIRFTPMD